MLLLKSPENVALLGGAAISDDLWRDLRAISGPIVAADGGAAHALRRGVVPQAVIGDMDSLSPADLAAMPPDRIHRVSEQETTDFDKALRAIQAPVVLGPGSAGRARIMPWRPLRF